MASELISYILLASIFIVLGLRMFVEKPGKPTELPFWRAENKPASESGLRESPEA